MAVGVEVLARLFLLVPVVAAGDEEIDDDHAHGEAEDAGDYGVELLEHAPMMTRQPRSRSAASTWARSQTSASSSAFGQ